MTLHFTGIDLGAVWIEGTTWANSNVNCTRQQLDDAVDYYHQRHQSPRVANHFRMAAMNALRVAKHEGKRV